VHLQASGCNDDDAEASYQCFQDFASRIKNDDDPTCFTPVRTEADLIERCAPLAAHAI
jgi:hypothetical protein